MHNINGSLTPLRETSKIPLRMIKYSPSLPIVIQEVIDNVFEEKKAVTLHPRNVSAYPSPDLPLEELLTFFSFYRDKGNEVLEERASQLIVERLSIDNFKIITQFINGLYEENHNRPINKTILLGLAHFAGKTIADYKLYAFPRQTIRDEALEIFDFFHKYGNLLSNITLHFAFGAQRFNLGMDFMDFFNATFSSITSELTLNADMPLFPTLLEKIFECPKVKKIRIFFKTPVMAESYQKKQHVIVRIMESKLFEFNEALFKFPRLSKIELRSGINFKYVSLKEEDPLGSAIAGKLVKMLAIKPLNKPRQMANINISVCCYPYR